MGGAGREGGEEEDGDEEDDVQFGLEAGLKTRYYANEWIALEPGVALTWNGEWAGQAVRLLSFVGLAFVF